MYPRHLCPSTLDGQVQLPVKDLYGSLLVCLEVRKSLPIGRDRAWTVFRWRTQTSRASLECSRSCYPSWDSCCWGQGLCWGIEVMSADKTLVIDASSELSSRLPTMKLSPCSNVQHIALTCVWLRFPQWFYYFPWRM